MTHSEAIETVESKVLELELKFKGEPLLPAESLSAVGKYNSNLFWSILENFKGGSITPEEYVSGMFSLIEEFIRFRNQNSINKMFVKIDSVAF